MKKKYSFRKKLIFSLAGILVFLAGVELEAFAFAKFSIGNGNGYQFFPADLFRSLPEEQRAREDGGTPLHLSKVIRPRPQPQKQASTCVSSFGDSMTHGDEVKDDEAWGYRLSLLLGCDVANYGMPGYGLDQSLLVYEQVQPDTRVVLLGVFIEMLRRGLAASWTFYQGPIANNLPRYEPTKVLFHMEGDGLVLIPPPPSPATREAIEAHHQHDYYRQTFWTPLQFPYSIAVAKALYKHLVLKVDRYNQSSNSFWYADHPSRATEIAMRIIGRFNNDVKQKNARLAIVFFPQYEELPDERLAYADFMESLARQQKDVCIVNLHPALRAASKNVERAKMRQPLGHYSPLGNQVIAEAIRDGLKVCNLLP